MFATALFLLTPAELQVVNHAAPAALVVINHVTPAPAPQPPRPQGDGWEYDPVRGHWWRLATVQPTPATTWSFPAQPSYRVNPFQYVVPQQQQPACVGGNCPRR